MAAHDDFSDMDDLDRAPTRADNQTQAAPAAQTMRCTKCSGSGAFRGGGICFTCKGSGQVSIHYNARRDAYKKGQQTQRTNRAERAQAWKEANKEMHAFLVAGSDRGWEFANSMLQAVAEYGRLTDNQQAAVERSMQRSAERRETRESEQLASASSLGDGAVRIRDALNLAAKNGLKAPKLICGAINFTRAKDGSKNPGFMYVKNGGAYVGKIDPQGTFLPSYDCTEADKATVARVALDPLGAAVEHGHMTGRCACCNRPLTDPESVKHGIGPICRTKYFGA